MGLVLHKMLCGLSVAVWVQRLWSDEGPRMDERLTRRMHFGHFDNKEGNLSSCFPS